jgi:hypothetical protein
MSTHDDAFTAEAKSLAYTFRAKAGTKPTWTPRWGFVTDEPRFDPRFKIGGQFGGWFYGVRAYGGHGWEVGGAEAKRGPEVNEYSDFAGVLGTGVYVTGVAGTSVNNVGVYGQTGEVPDLPFPVPYYVRAGVLGAAEQGRGVFGVSAFGEGVTGFSPKGAGVEGFTTDGIGVVGSARKFPGVYGVSGTAPAVYGNASYDSGVMGICDTEGPTVGMNIPTIAGVVGTADQRPGVIGTSNALMGVYGFSTSNAGVVGETASPGSFAGYFAGNVHITGNLTVAGPLKAAVVAFPDGTQRALHCMESPEAWFEDFGAAKLKRGRAVVKLDADFASVIKRGDYKVFPAPEGDCRGLYVRRKRTASFEVRELSSGKSNVAFSYRIVGRRKDIRRHRRFAKVDTRLSLPAAATRAPRKGAPTAAMLRTLLDRFEKQARELRAKGGRARARPKQPPPPLHVRRPQRPKNIRRRAPNPHML